MNYKENYERKNFNKEIPFLYNYTKIDKKKFNEKNPFLCNFRKNENYDHHKFFENEKVWDQNEKLSMTTASKFGDRSQEFIGIKALNGLRSNKRKEDLEFDRTRASRLNNIPEELTTTTPSRFYNIDKSMSRISTSRFKSNPLILKNPNKNKIEFLEKKIQDFKKKNNFLQKNERNKKNLNFVENLQKSEPQILKNPKFSYLSHLNNFNNFNHPCYSNQIEKSKYKNNIKKSVKFAKEDQTKNKRNLTKSQSLLKKKPKFFKKPKKPFVAKIIYNSFSENLFEKYLNKKKHWKIIKKDCEIFEFDNFFNKNSNLDQNQNLKNDDGLSYDFNKKYEKNESENNAEVNRFLNGVKKLVHDASDNKNPSSNSKDKMKALSHVISTLVSNQNDKKNKFTKKESKAKKKLKKAKSKLKFFI